MIPDPFFSQVQVETPDHAFTPGEPRDVGTEGQGNARSKAVISGTAERPGLKWAATVTLHGPDGGHGVRQMIVGFIQNLHFVKDQGTYASHGVVARLDVDPNSFYLDMIDRDRPTDPFYDATAAALLYGAVQATKTLESSDIPGNGPPGKVRSRCADTHGPSLGLPPVRCCGDDRRTEWCQVGLRPGGRSGVAI